MSGKIIYVTVCATTTSGGENIPWLKQTTCSKTYAKRPCLVPKKIGRLGKWSFCGIFFSMFII
jgi:hypothetical protein